MMRRTLTPHAALAGTLALAGLFGCVERAPELSPADRERIREFVGTEAPDPEHDLDVRFAEGVRLLGYDVSTERATPGQAFTVTWYWKSEFDMDEGWQLFTHVADADGENRLNQDRVGVVREIYQPGRWRAGQYIRDVQQITLPADWNSSQATLYLGMWKGDQRLAVQSGPNDGDDRVRALSLDVTGGAAAAAEPGANPGSRRAQRPTPRLNIPRANGEIDIDGELNDADWERAGRTAAFVDTMTGEEAPFGVTARTLWDDDHLYVAFEVADDFVQNTLTERDAHLWEQDAVEIMIDPGGRGQNYFELQVSPTGAVFDTRYDSRRQPGPIGHADWNAELRAEARVRGTANDDEADEGYTVEIAIPWGAFDAGETPASRPSGGDRWRMNLYVMDQRQGDAPDRAAGWSAPMTGDFHVPERFATVTFAGPPAAAVAQADGEPIPNAIPVQQVRPEIARQLREAAAFRPNRAENVRVQIQPRATP